MDRQIFLLFLQSPKAAFQMMQQTQTLPVFHGVGPIILVTRPKFKITFTTLKYGWVELTITDGRCVTSFAF